MTIAVVLTVVAVALILGLHDWSGPAATADLAPDATSEAPAQRGASDAAPRADSGALDAAQPATAGPSPAPAALRLVAARVAEDPSATTGSFEGRVVSWSTGAGVSGAELTFDRGGVLSSTRSGDDGSFRFVPAEAGRYGLVSVAAEGYLPYAPEWGHSPIGLHATPGRRITDVTITLRPAIDYAGEVVDPDGRPVAGAEVTILSTPGGEAEMAPGEDRFRTDEAGAFTFHAPDGAILEARHEPFGPGRASLDRAAQVSHRLVIQLTPEGTESGGERISGTAESPDGEPLAGVMVLAHLEVAPSERGERDLLTIGQAVTDAEGRFELPGLDAGTYRLLASHRDFAPAEEGGVRAGTEGLRLRLGVGAALRGRVTDRETGDPVPGFSVVVSRREGALALRPYRTVTVFDADGRYEVLGVASGDYSVVATAHGYAPSAGEDVRVPTPLPAEAVTADFALGRGGRLTGRVVDSESHGPLENARVSVESATGGGAAVPLVATATTDSSGAFELAGLTTGLRSVFVAAYGHHSRIISGLTVEENGDIGPLTIDLRPVAEDEEPQLELTGIGAVLTLEGDALVVGRTIEAGGAAEAGLAPGDAILTIDGLPVEELGFDGSIERIRGPEGTTVRLTVRRAGSEAVGELVVHRRRVQTS